VSPELFRNSQALFDLEHVLKSLDSLANGVRFLPKPAVFRMVGVTGKFAGKKVKFVALVLAANLALNGTATSSTVPRQS